MGTLSLTDPVNSTTADATLIATNNAAIKAVVNGGIENVNVAADAALAISKLASYPSNATKALFGDGSWNVIPSTELAYVEFTATVTSTGTTFAAGASVVSAGALTFDGATKIRVEVFIPIFSCSSASVYAQVSLADGGTGGTDLGFLAQSASTTGYTALAVREFTPAAAIKTYSAVIWVASAATGSAQAGAGGAGTKLPGYIRVVKV